VAGSEEIAAFVAFLLGDEASSVTGAALAIDGGATAG
jgi:NAD(P)-dependent dehydrogenase (short-subunit alcohol dehydrogenase family)